MAKWAEHLLRRHCQRVRLLATRAAGRKDPQRPLQRRELGQELPKRVKVLRLSEEVGLVDRQPLANCFQDRPLTAESSLQVLFNTRGTGPLRLLLHDPREALPQELCWTKPKARENLVPNLPQQRVHFCDPLGPNTLLEKKDGQAQRYLELLRCHLPLPIVLGQHRHSSQSSNH